MAEPEQRRVGDAIELRSQGVVELLAAMALTTVLPVVLLGRMEGNTGAVVILSGLGLAVAMPALRLGARLHRTK